MRGVCHKRVLMGVSQKGCQWVHARTQGVSKKGGGGVKNWGVEGSGRLETGRCL